MLLGLLKRIVRGARPSPPAPSSSKPPPRDEVLRAAQESLNAGDTVQAIRQLSGMLLSDPEQRDACLLLAEAQQTAGNAAAAVPLLERALRSTPQDAHLLIRLGIAEAMAGRCTHAVERFRSALDLDPSLSDARVNLGNAYRLLGRLDDAGEAYESAISRAPDYADAWHNYGLYLRDRNRDADAVDAFTRVLDLDPGHLEARFARALALLGSGDLERGWPEYETRLKLPRLAHAQGVQAVPRWQGEALLGRGLLVTCEQGVGDEIVFATLLFDLEHAGGRIAVECREKIRPLLQRTFPWIELIPYTHPPESRLHAGWDYQIPIGSLPSLLRRRFEDFPPAPRRLTVDPVKAAHWRDWLASLGPGFKVGVCWRSSDRSEERALSCTELQEWDEVLAVPGVTFVNLQYDECGGEVAAAKRAFGVELHEPPGLDQFDDLDAVAALMSGLDLVISAPTTVSVQAAALDVRTWQLMYGSDWHSHGTTGNPWLPSIERFARNESQGWSPTLAVIARRLRAEVAGQLSEGPATLEAAMSAYAAGSFDEAQTIAVRSLLATSGAAAGDVHQLLAAIMRARGFLAGAIGHARRAVACCSDLAEPHLIRATLAQELGWQEEVAAAIGAAYRLAADRPEIALAYAHSRLSEGCAIEALACVETLVQQQPDCFEARLQLGTLRFEAGAYGQAISEYRHALDLRPESSHAAFNLANALRVTGEFGESKTLYEQAVNIDPNLVGAWLSLGAIAHDTLDYPRALAAYDRALAIVPDYLPARLNRAYALLGSGDLVRGWPAHEIRLTLPERAVEARRHAQPRWQGEPLAGRTLLVWGEQGPGDEINFAALFEELHERIGSFVLECRPKLLPLFQRTFPGVIVVPRADPPHAQALRAQLQIPAGSLGGMLRPDTNSFPRRSAYLVANPVRIAYWRSRLAELGDGPKIGFCWRSGNTSGDRALACSKLADWMPMFGVSEAHFICLQYDDCSAELDEAAAQGARVTRFADVDYFDDLDEVGALMSALDLVVSAPTVVSIQAAALGVPTWQLTFGSDWQTHGTTANLWLPAIKRYPRRWDEPWRSVLEKVASDLRTFVTDGCIDKDASRRHAPRLEQGS